YCLYSALATPASLPVPLHDALPILFGLLDDLQLPESHEPQAAALRERVERGLNWYELVPVLDDLAVLMRAATSESQREFENYLRSEEHTSELQSRENLVCRLLLEKK